MQKLKRWISTTIFALAAGACDEVEDAPDRGADADMIALRPSGTGGTGSGSTLLNTGHLDTDGTPILYFSRLGAQTTYDDSAHTRVTFTNLRVRSGNSTLEFSPASANIQVTPTGVTINGAPYSPGQLVGSEWTFSAMSDTMPARVVTLRLDGAALAYVPGGSQVPLYNFRFASIDPAWSNVCAPLDPITVGNVVWDGVTGVPPGVSNNFSLPYTAVLYPSLRADSTGQLFADSNQIYLGCTSGAIGKGALWGYPTWVSTYQNMTGIQQLQAVTRAIRADYCADGTPHTVDGTPIQVRDRFRSAFDDPTEATESVWGGSGTQCRVLHPRLSNNGATYTCSASTNQDCNKLGSNWILGSQQFMWTKLDPNTTTFPPKTACNTASTTRGCADPGVEYIVCEQDSYCCVVAWDSICVSEVAQLGAGGDACCVDNGGPGCGNPGVSSCVGGYDGYCTASRWDSLCALEVESLGCGRCR